MWHKVSIPEGGKDGFLSVGDIQNVTTLLQKAEANPRWSRTHTEWIVWEFQNSINEEQRRRLQQKIHIVLSPHRELRLYWTGACTTLAPASAINEDIQ
jgi:hypothetical protein